jgi:hypothetical protein
MKNLFKLIFLFSLCDASSQVAGESAYQFLNITTSPRQLALGGKEITLFDYDVNLEEKQEVYLKEKVRQD